MKPILVTGAVLILGMAVNAAEWVMENAALKATFQDDSGRITVVDKRLGKTWEQPAPRMNRNPTVAVRRIADWKDIERCWRLGISHTMTADATKIDNANDCSALLHVGWNGTSLLIRAEVKDDVYKPSSVDMGQWWEQDSIEMWVTDQQFFVPVMVGTHPVRTTVNNDVADSSVTVTRTADGYRADISFPLAAVGLQLDKPNQPLTFALGVNDADSGNREGQIYYPSGWVHSQPATFESMMLCDADGKLPAAVPAKRVCFEDMAWLEAGKAVRWRETRPGIGALIRECTLNGDEMCFSETAEKPETATKTVTSGYMFYPQHTGMAQIVADYADGHAYPLTDPLVRRSFAFWSGVDMPWVGLVDMKQGYGYSIMVDTSDNATLSFDKTQWQDQQTLIPCMKWEPSKGTFGTAARKYRVAFFDRGGYVAMAKRWRETARAWGYLVTLKEKAKRNPNVYKLMGAADIWSGASLAFASEAYQLGIDRLLINGSTPAADMQKMNDMGYLTGKYDNYTDILPMEDGKLNSNHGRIPEDVVMQADGKTRKTAWLTFDKKLQYMKRCPALWVPSAKAVIPPELAARPFNTRFIDVTTAEGLYECYDPEHPLDHEAKRKCGEDLLAYVSQELNLVSGGEHGRWWGMKSLHYIEGMMSGGNVSWPSGHLLRPKTKDHNLWNPDKPWDLSSRTSGWGRYIAYGISHEHRLPLWELVFHDCCVSTWYWGDATDFLLEAAPEITPLKDAWNVLYGTVPLFWVHAPGSWKTDRNGFIRSYFHTSMLHRAIGMCDMVSHEMLKDDYTLQKSVFDDGTECVVNFGNEPCDVTVGGKSYNLLAKHGFVAVGPSIVQYFVQEGTQAVSQVRTKDFYFSSISPLDSHKEMRWMRAKRVREGYVEIHASYDNAVVGREFWDDDAAKGLLYVCDDNGRQRLTQGEWTAEGLKLPKAGSYHCVWGRELAKSADVCLKAISRVDGGVSCTVANQGGVPVSARVRVYAMAVKDDMLLGEASCGAVAVGTTATVVVPLDEARLLGTVKLVAVVEPVKATELNPSDNRYNAFETYAAKDWQAARTVTIGPSEVDLVNAPVELENFTLPAGWDASDLIVLKKVNDHDYVPQTDVQVMARDGQGTLLFTVTQPAGTAGEYTIARYRSGKPFLRRSWGYWDSGETQGAGTFVGNNYEVTFSDGKITQLRLPGGKSFLNDLCVSNQTSGWREENWNLNSFDVRQGTVLTEIHVVRATAKNRYEKVYLMYPDRMVVRFSIDTAEGGLYSRGFYSLDADYRDSGGITARMDGHGQAEGVYNTTKNPRWFALRGDGWAHSCVATADDFQTIAYWDSPETARGQLGFYTSKTQNLTYTYFFHGQQPNFDFAEQDWKRANLSLKK